MVPWSIFQPAMLRFACLVPGKGSKKYAPFNGGLYNGEFSSHGIESVKTHQKKNKLLKFISLMYS